MKKIIIFLLAIFLYGCQIIEAPINDTQNITVINTNTANDNQTNTTPEKNNEPKNEDIVCTMDAMLCPDGTYVSRVAPDCNFAPCPEIGKLIQPIAEFDKRISKKPFSIYITPKDSPVQPEKFTGYHTGADVEYSDMPDADITVHAIADGQVVRSGWVSGYGGMIAIRHNIEGKDYIVIYGHLKPDTLEKNESDIKSNQVIGLLGQGYSYDTDGERKHLHFAIYTGTDINVQGYAQSQDELKKWLDPQKFLLNK
ncbi:M23 family metallopeptidase [Patescibacteria group bacterium]|nr:M23 family metallopeptidase [Patescibacteria group bacterium]